MRGKLEPEPSLPPYDLEELMSGADHLILCNSTTFGQKDLSDSALHAATEILELRKRCVDFWHYLDWSGENTSSSRC